MPPPNSPPLSPSTPTTARRSSFDPSGADRAARPIDAILFDLGGTLDGQGGWRDRFHRLFAEVGFDQCSRAQRIAAFDYAEERSHATPEMGTVQLRRMLQKHIGWQLERLGLVDRNAEGEMVNRFVAEVEQAAATNRLVLATLLEQGFRLGVVSNACGNAALLCEEFGYSPMLSAIVDSHVFGVSKPDLAIFRHGLSLLAAEPERSAFVGDSLDRDIEPAKRLGMTTFWIAAPPAKVPRPDEIPDATLASVAELPGLLQHQRPRQA
jgi:HAD superfamily hydrolase (TIGR01509 family)